MRKSMKTLAAASALVAGLAAAPLIYAHESQDSRGSMMGQGMMGQGMMGMMGQMSGMMEGCNTMMQSMNHGQGTARLNEQWRGESPEPPANKADTEGGPPATAE